MTDQSKTQKPEKPVRNLELNRETLQDLTEEEGANAAGGMIRPKAPTDICTDWCTDRTCLWCP